MTAKIERTRREHLSFGPTWTDGITLQWVHPDDFRYLDRGDYDNAGTVELALTGGVSTRSGAWSSARKARSEGDSRTIAMVSPPAGAPT